MYNADKNSIMREKCCCGFGSSACIKLIATFDIFLAFAQLGTTIFAYQLGTVLSTYVEPTLGKQHDDFALAVLQFSEGNNSSSVMALIILLIAVTTVDVTASFCLLYGVVYMNPTYCKWWYRIRVLLLGLFVIYFFIEMSRYHLFLYGIADILKIFYRMYTLATVSSYTRKLEKELRRRERIWNRVLTPSYPPVGAGTQTEESGGYLYPRYSPQSPSSPLVYHIHRQPDFANMHPSPGYNTFSGCSNYGAHGNIPPSLPSLY